MRFVPHDYQSHVIQFILDHPEAALLIDMGLGKTVMTLTAIDGLMHDSFEVASVLVVAPIRVCWQWLSEVSKWDHLKHLKVSVACGSEKERRDAIEADADIHVINREQVAWLQETYPRRTWDMLVIDELSSFKNHQSKRWKALKKMRPSFQRAVGLTGTPAPNSLMDLWAEFRLLDLGKRLGPSIGRYRTEYFRPDKTNGMIVYSYRLRPGAGEKIHGAIADITVSMKALDHLKMPELVSIKAPAVLDEREMGLYREFRDNLVLDVDAGTIAAVNAASLCGKLTQMANGAVYTDSGLQIVHDRKLDVLEDLVEAANGKPLLVAYWYKHDLARIQELLGRMGVGCRCIDCKESIALWNEGRLPVGLIHPASAGHGLNLQQGGNTLVWFGLTWSLELYQQTNARLWRQGQSSGTVVIYHIVAPGTMDERILSALASKNVGQSALMEAVKAEIRGGGHD